MSSPPVILVNGYMAPRAAMLPMQWRLRRRGFDVHVAELSPLCIQSVDTLALELAASIGRVRARSGALQVDLVGISQGGTVALRYLQAHGGAPSVRRFVAVGTPFHGTWAAAAALPALGAISDGLWQLLPTSPFVRSALALGAPPEVETTSIAMHGDLVAPPARCALPGAASVVLTGRTSPLTHQWLVMSRAALDAVVDALRHPDAPPR